MSHCDDDVEGDLYHYGTGHLTWVGTTSQSPGCNVINCIGDGEPLWPISNLGERNPNVVHISTRICLRANGTDFHCDAELNVVGSSFHVQNATMTQLCVNGTRRVEVQWSDTDDGSHDSIEIVHLEG